ncbi:MAG TPA: EAL domain-containing protein [Acidobacteriaceae bacterium]|nr:EAL domain-containing protein [Acidobacteriaceae bacterium]
MAQQLHGATDRNELVLHYQPIVSIETGALRGFEALLRWMQPAMGEIPPDPEVSPRFFWFNQHLA